MKWSHRKSKRGSRTRTLHQNMKIKIAKSKDRKRRIWKYIYSEQNLLDVEPQRDGKKIGEDKRK